MGKKLQELKTVGYFFKPYKWRLIILLCLMLISGLMETLNIAALYPVVNYGLNLKNHNLMLRISEWFMDFIWSSNQLFASCVMLMVITAAAVLFKYIYSSISNKLVAQISAETQKRIFHKFASLDYSFFNKNQQGRLVYTSTIASNQVADVVLYATKLTYDLIFSLLLFGLLFALTYKGTLLLIAIGIIYSFFVKNVMEKVISRCAHTATDEDRKKNIILNEVITGIKSIKIFRNFSYWSSKYNEAVEKSVLNKYRMLMGRLLPESFMRFIFFTILAVLGIALSASPQDVIVSALPLFATFAMVASRFFPSLQLVGNDFMVIADSMPNVETIHNLCIHKEAAVSTGAKKLSQFDDKITFDNVWFRYSQMNDFVLKGFCAEIKKKEITAIVGLSGAGKTTIVNLLLRLYVPTQGKIKIDGVDILEYTTDSYLDKVSYVGQETFIFNDTIKENIRFGLAGCNDEMIVEAAKKAYAHEFIINSENGYDTIVGDAGMKLSGGQRQRIAISRAILHKPELIILDEATSSLDNISEINIQKAMDELSTDTTVLVIAHRLSTIRNANKIIVLKEGRALEEGNHKELFENKKLYFNLYMKRGSHYADKHEKQPE